MKYCIGILYIFGLLFSKLAAIHIHVHVYFHIWNNHKPYNHWDIPHLVDHLIETAVLPCEEDATQGCPSGSQHADIVRRKVEQGSGLQVHLTKGISGEGWVIR